MKLKEHFSTGAMTTIESIFWISKSKSAFVNYRTDEALLDAENRFHNSRFEGIRLVCRARRANIPNPLPTTTTTLRTEDDNEPSPLLAFEDKNGKKVETLSRASEVNTKAPFNINAKKRFFIMKSLTKEDLELSVQNGHWITQKHNEMTLNRAFTV